MKHGSLRTTVGQWWPHGYQKLRAFHNVTMPLLYNPGSKIKHGSLRITVGWSPPPPYS